MIEHNYRAGLFVANCERCGKQFRWQPRGNYKARYCSLSCANKSITPTEEAKAIELYRSGLGLKRIGILINKSRAVVRGALRRSGINPKDDAWVRLEKYNQIRQSLARDRVGIHSQHRKWSGAGLNPEKYQLESLRSELLEIAKADELNHWGNHPEIGAYINSKWHLRKRRYKCLRKLQREPRWVSEWREQVESELPNWLIRRRLSFRSALQPSEFPQEFIDTLKIHLQLKRLIKERTHK